jgi:hypothetical protein
MHQPEQAEIEVELGWFKYLKIDSEGFEKKVADW